jgi:hypothetical protein
MVSRDGKVKSIKRVVDRSNGWAHPVRERVLRPVTEGGYKRVALMVNNKLKSFRIHRLVASAFIGKDTREINHKNGNKQDNRVENLEYCTRSENLLHAFKTGLAQARRGDKNGNSKVTVPDVIAIRRLVLLNVPSREIGEIFGINKSTVLDIKNNITWRGIGLV